MARRIERAARERQRRHTPDFKVEAVRLMRERLASGVTLQRVSEELEVGPDLLRVWAKAVEAAPDDAPASAIFPGGGKRRAYPPTSDAAAPAARAPAVGVGVEAVEAELARLRRENERLRQERDFLKKAAAFFAKESR